MSELAGQQQIATDALVAIMLSFIDNAVHLRLMGFSGNRCTASELWNHFAATLCRRNAGQRTADSVQRAACSVQRAACSVQRAACSVQWAAWQDALDCIQDA